MALPIIDENFKIRQEIGRITSVDFNLCILILTDGIETFLAFQYCMELLGVKISVKHFKVITIEGSQIKFKVWWNEAKVAVEFQINYNSHLEMRAPLHSGNVLSGANFEKSHILLHMCSNLPVAGKANYSFAFYC